MERAVVQFHRMPDSGYDSERRYSRFGCQTYGEVVRIGADSSTIWDKIQTPTGRIGYLTDMAVVDSWRGFAPRIPRCGGVASRSAYYQPRFSPDDPVPPSTVIPRDRWSSGSCAPESAYSFPGSVGNERVTTLARWSLGRLGPTYLLYWFFERSKEINSIVLFDPGSFDERIMRQVIRPVGIVSTVAVLGPIESTSDPCRPSDERCRTANGPYAHRGIQEALFPRIRGSEDPRNKPGFPGARLQLRRFGTR